MKSIGIILVLGAGLCSSPTICLSQAVSRSYSPSAVQTTGSSWLSEPWTGDNRPYNSLRLKLKQQLLSGANPDDLLKQCRITAQSHIFDPLAQFKWAYVALIAANTPSGYDLKKLNGVREALSRIPSPHVPEYTRVQFLVECRVNSSRGLAGVGERLLRYDPKDLAVKYDLIDAYDATNPVEKKKAVVLAKQIIQQHPEKPSYYTKLGGVYWAAWNQGKSPKDADYALIAYRKYLAKAPPGSVDYGFIKRLVKHIAVMKNYRLESREWVKIE